MVVVELRDPGEEGPDPDPGEGPTPDLDGTGQGRPGEADMTVPVRASSLAEAGVPNPLAAERTAAAATTTTAAKGTTTRMRRRTAPPRTLAEVRIIPSPLPLPLWKLGVPHSLLLLLSCC